jgi:hypothetical protein
VWASAQDAAPQATPDRQRVPSLAELQAELARLRRDTHLRVGGPALEHAALALTRAREAERAHQAGSAVAADEALRSRRIAYAALALVVAQRDRERARILRDEAAEARRAADGAVRSAAEAVRVARANAAAAEASSDVPRPAATPTVGTTPAAGTAAGTATEAARPDASGEGEP